MQLAHPLFAPFPNEFEFQWPYDGRRAVIEWVERDNEVFWREGGTNPRRIWQCFKRLSARSEKQRAQFGYSSSLANEGPRNHFSYAMQTMLLRRFYIEGRDELLLNGRTAILHRPGRQVDYSCRLPANLFADFFKPHRYLLAEPEVVQELIAAWRTDPESELAAGSQWHADFQQPWCHLHFTRGSADELEPLLRALCILFSPLYFRQKHYSFFIRCPHRRLQVSGRNLQDQIPQQYFDLLNRRFSFHFDGSVRVRGMLHPWLKPSTHNLSAFRSLDLALTTEQIDETLALWRDFLRTEYSNEEVAALLTKTRYSNS